jgi:hypothetical protein
MLAKAVAGVPPPLSAMNHEKPYPDRGTIFLRYRAHLLF